MELAGSGRVLRITQTVRALQLYRDYHKKHKGKVKDKKHRQIDLNEILGANTQTISHATSEKNVTVKTNVGSWQASQERLGLLRKGEKRVAIVAVVVLVLAFGVMKFMLHGMPRKELQETDNNN